MITVEPTPHNWGVYNQLCELDAEYRVCKDEQGKRDIIALAHRLCDELEFEKSDLGNSEAFK